MNYYVLIIIRRRRTDAGDVLIATQEKTGSTAMTELAILKKGNEEKKTPTIFKFGIAYNILIITFIFTHCSSNAVAHAPTHCWRPSGAFRSARRTRPLHSARPLAERRPADQALHPALLGILGAERKLFREQRRE